MQHLQNMFLAHRKKLLSGTLSQE